jgi:xanthine dehydrogenase molybdopterin-binding subunit B
MSASVHVYADGSVLVQTGGLEMGQGLFTKVKQARAFASSACCGYPKPGK